MYLLYSLDIEKPSPIIIKISVSANSNNAIKELLNNYSTDIQEKVVFTDVLSKVGK